MASAEEGTEVPAARLRAGERARAVAVRAARSARALVARRAPSGEAPALAGLIVLTGVVWALVVFIKPSPLPVAALAVPVVLGNLVLGFRAQLRLLVVVLVAAGAALGQLGVVSARIGSVGVVAVVALIVLRTAYNRDRLGLHGIPGDALLADLRDRLAGGGVALALPAGWHLEVAQRLSGGGTFGGDFFVSDRRPDRLELALVDVSGKGVAAATRALQLSGALGGLVGSVVPAQFLAAANGYVLRQRWDEGFATAVHVTVDLATGSYVLDSAGHPPAATFRGDTGTWALSTADGPALGFIDQAAYDGEPGRLGRGDALLLYTDGVVEVAGQDLAQGIDRLLGAANRLVVDGFADGADRLLAAMPDASGDDRAVLLLWRS